MVENELKEVSLLGGQCGLHSGLERCLLGIGEGLVLGICVAKESNFGQCVGVLFWFLLCERNI